MSSIWNLRMFQPCVPPEEVSTSEKICGHFIGPTMVAVFCMMVSGQYLIQFYTDVLGLGGALLLWMPVAAKVTSGLTGMMFGRIIDHTQTAQGKARPWILISSVLLAAAGLMLYSVPSLSSGLGLLWVIISYYLFFCFAQSLYGISHALMVPRASQNVQQRESLAMIASMASTMIPGMMVTVGMPLLVRWLGVGLQAQGRWMKVMGTLAVLVVPAAILEYYFTRERLETKQTEPMYTEPLTGQLRDCMHNRTWLRTFFLLMLAQFSNALSSSSMLYYCNWVLGSSVAQGAVRQILVTVIGQSPMGLGILLLWPAIRHFGRDRMAAAGFLLAAAGSIMIMLAGKQLTAVLVGMFVRSIGLLPCYLFPAYQAEAMDALEKTGGSRADGLSASLMGTGQGIAAGAGQSVVLVGLSAFGYQAPESAEQIIVQPFMVRTGLIICIALLPAVCYMGCALILKRQKGIKDGLFL